MYDETEGRLRPAFKVGLVVDSLRGPAWLADVVSAIEETGDAIVVDVVATGRGAAAGTARVGGVLLRAYCWLDGLVFGRPDDPSRIVDLERHATAIRRHEAADADINEPDVVIRLDGRESSVERWPDPPLGVWAMLHGMGLPPADRPERSGLTPGGPEMLLDRTITISQLVAMVGGERRVIGQVVSAVDPLSMRRGARGHLRKLPGLVARTVRAVQWDGERPDIGVESAAHTGSSEGETLGTVEIARGLARILVGYVFRLIERRVRPELWVVGISRERHLPRSGGDPSFRILEAPEGTEWADPFPLRTPEADLVFIEEYVHETHRGRLAVVELDDSPRGWRSIDTILDLPTHLSYPFVFEWSGAWYLLPEQAATGGLQLYAAESFPHAWRWHSTALDLPAADATVVEIDGRWWMFAAIAVVGGIAADELHLFHAETPLGPWTAHARNPVVSDVRSARPAGRIFRRDGTWYRVAQDGAISYGHSIAVARIDRIDLDGYRETVVEMILPDWAPGLVATHTINSDNGLAALDARRT